MSARVTRTLLVAWDGVHATEVAEGTILEGDQAAHAVEQGFAVEVKDAGPAPENRAHAAAPENKAKGRR